MINFRLWKRSASFFFLDYLQLALLLCAIVIEILFVRIKLSIRWALFNVSGTSISAPSNSSVTGPFRFFFSTIKYFRVFPPHWHVLHNSRVLATSYCLRRREKLLKALLHWELKNLLHVFVIKLLLIVSILFFVCFVSRRSRALLQSWNLHWSQFFMHSKPKALMKFMESCWCAVCCLIKWKCRWKMVNIRAALDVNSMNSRETTTLAVPPADLWGWFFFRSHFLRCLAHFTACHCLA